VTLDRTQIAKFVYVGQGGPLSTIPLQNISKKGLLPSVIIIADKSQRPTGLNLLPVQPPRVAGSLANLAHELGVPVIDWQKGYEADIAEKLIDIDVDVAIMSCFPWRIPDLLLGIPKQGWWNLHPSLLPAYRGPTPLFWQARAGEMQTGISLHQVTSTLDSGAILGQQVVPMSYLDGREWESALAEQGANLIERALQALVENSLQPCVQREGEASYQGFPQARDMRIATSGTASAAHRFIGLMKAVYPLWFEINGQRLSVVESIRADDSAVLPSSHQFRSDNLQIQFKKGVLTVKVAS